ncbi:TIGR04222 domain-containing membrane protein [Streptomyces sp. ME18-1-4]|uniref:TIGR04222 domain-containing membrane protein n=1 Tax=Streptomyces sp. ME18-1-4 TaxID=3028685 RepID=UPI0029A93469|nr:TIGR04222 domain-containing membrane protein [Streptomyces sp. ME18-1-4]MDX3240482.1 TIGR04222 domain-containing membrane protein [Streptomyces sp. ME18-1-4]
MSGGTSVRLEPYEVALLRGGSGAAVTVAVLALHLRGLIEVGRPGRIRATGTAPSEDAGDDLFPLPAAVYATLQRFVSIPELETRPDVHRALAELRAGLVAAGMLRSLPPRRTRTARRTLSALRLGHPLPTLPADRKGLPSDDILMAVALHGEAALSVLAARFALRAGLTARAEVADKGFHRRAPRGGGTGGFMYSCGGGGGTD